MTAALMIGTAGLLFALARAWARRYGEALTLHDPAMWLLAVLATLEVTFRSDHHVASAIVLALCLVCALTDRQTGYIFNVVLLCGTALLLPCILARGDLEGAVLGAALCGGTMQFLHVATRGRGLGLGDVKLAAFIGAGLSLPAGPEALGVAFVAGSASVVVLALVRGIRRRGTMAFGPYLAAGSMLAVAIAGPR